MNLTHIEDLYDLSPTQQGMLFHSLGAPDSGVYGVQLCLTLEGALDQTALQQAWQAVIQQHSILRTAFQWEGLEKPLQVVYRQAPIPFQALDWQACSPVEQKQQLESWLQSDRRQGFDLAHPPLMRLTLIQTSATTYRLIWSKHHLILDGWSTGIVLQQVWQRYHQLVDHRSGTIQGSLYRHYIAWLQQQDLAAAETFWRQTLEGFTAPTQLRLEQPTASEPSASYPEQRLRLSPATTTALQSLARQHQLTLNTLLQGAWAMLLSRYSGESDIVFGATVAGRPPSLPGVESLVGLLINTLPVRVAVSPDVSLLHWLQQLQAQQVEARQYEYTPLIQIQGWSQVPRGMSLFETLLVVENYPVDPALAVGDSASDLAITDVRALEQTNYPLTVVAEVGDELVLRLSYNPQRFEPEAMTRLLGHWQTLLTAIAENPDRNLGKFSLLTTAERQQLLLDWNPTQVEFPDACLHQVLEQQAERTPEAIAVRFGDQPLTYAALHQQANQLAQILQNQGIGPGSLVGLCVERSPALLIGLLGILKAGAAYLPLDPLYPPERLAFILEDSQASLVLTQQTLLAILPPTNAPVLCLDTLPLGSAHGEAHSPNSPNSSHPATLTALAYVIYTSGSTGKPKGVQISHRAVVNFLNSMAQTPGLTAADRLLAVTTLAFDIAGLELFLPLWVGAQVVIAPPELTTDGEKLAAYLEEAEITVMQATPATWRLLLAAGWQGKPDLKMLCGGEALTADLAEQLLPRGAELWNLYGPTETTIWSTVHRVETVTPTIPIGRAIANTQIYVLDPQQQPVPLGVPGELYVGGAGVAQGYLDRADLTAERFINWELPILDFHPGRSDMNGLETEKQPNLKSKIQNPKSTRLYRTGDLVRYRADGILECLGRLDHQVKLRGFRIELGEIEAVLLQHPAVQSAVVVAHTEDLDNSRLIAYIVLHPEQPATSQELRQSLKQTLPPYMVPTAFVALDHLPLTPNGKIDRRALPAPAGESLNPDVSQISPRTPTEQALHQIWCRVLNLPQASVTANFFDLGGHSLLAMQLIAQVREQFQLEVPLQRLFEHPTIAQLAGYIDEQKQAATKPATAPRAIARQARRGVSFATLSSSSGSDSPS
jgi:amino acid adenylation domain-containing protein